MSLYPPVLELVPHRPPMLLLDEVLEHSAERLCARSLVPASSPFLERGEAPALITIEYMAQAIAAFAGLQCRAAGQPIRPGFLIGCREMILEADVLRAGDQLEIEVTQLWSDGQLGNFHCSVARRGENIARAWLSVFQDEARAEPG